jgi:tRNA (mo5U34)-methyltransferase
VALLSRRGRAHKAVEDISWFHSVDLGDGVVTPGAKSVELLRGEFEALGLPADMTGMRVLDIGAWDGFFSFEAESRGADVVALDHYVWSVDTTALNAHNRERAAQGLPAQPADVVPGMWDPKGLPGKAGFDLAHARRKSRVKVEVGDTTTMNLEPLGTFDVVLYLGVLYHLQDPIGALRKLRTLTKGRALIETASLTLPEHGDRALWQFIEGTELNGDPTNWWVPTVQGALAACRAAGFSEVTVQRATEPDENCWGRLLVNALS